MLLRILSIKTDRYDAIEDTLIGYLCIFELVCCFQRTLRSITFFLPILAKSFTQALSFQVTEKNKKKRESRLRISPQKLFVLQFVSAWLVCQTTFLSERFGIG